MSPPLTSDSIARIKAFKAILDEVYPKSLDDWIQGFELDWNHERELLMWECMALTYRTYTEGRVLSMEAKHEVLQVALDCSLGRTEEYILKKTWTAFQKIEILGLVDCYRAAAEAIYAVNRGRKTI